MIDSFKKFLAEQEIGGSVERKDMPQVKRNMSEFIQYLLEYGCTIGQPEMININLVRPSQKEVNDDKVKDIVAQIQSDPSLLPSWVFLVSKDFDLLDGHHRLVAIKSMNPEAMVWARIVDLDINDLILLGNKFNEE
jgi:hypothetical protein